MSFGDVQTRRAGVDDAEGIARAHIDSIRSIGPAFYEPDVVEAWGSGLTADLYVKAMDSGEAFFIATGVLDGETVVLGFATHRVDDDQDGASVYVRGPCGAARLMSGQSMPCVVMRRRSPMGETDNSVDRRRSR